MIFNMKKNVFLGILFMLITIPVFTYAQVQENIQSYDTMVNEGDFVFEVNPENPGPNELVTIKLTSDLVDTNRYPITWTVDGIVVETGIGKRTIQTKTKNYGETTVVEISIKLAESTVTKRIALSPNDSTILWEAIDSYVPPFYPGKKLPSAEALVRIVSIPNFLSSKLSTATKNAVYTWTRNKSAITEASGYGKDFILIKHNKIRESEIIGVTSSSTDGSRVAKTNIVIPFFDPQIVFYTKNRATGITEQNAISSLNLTAPVTTLIATPYFFSTVDDTPQFLKTKWTMNNKKINPSDASKPNRLIIQKPESSGSATIGISIENPGTLFQTATKNISVSFRK